MNMSWPYYGLHKHDLNFRLQKVEVLRALKRNDILTPSNIYKKSILRAKYLRHIDSSWERLTEERFP